MDEFVFTIPGRIDQYWYNKGYVKYFLDKAQGKPVRLKVTSYGGDVGEAVAISNLLAEHGNVTVEFIGFNASAATWMAFGAKTVEAHEDAMWLAHKCSFPVDIYGALNGDQLDDKIKELENLKKNSEAIDLMIAKKYADRCKKKVKDVMNLMEQSRWMPASEALEWGFIDKILPGINQKTVISDEIFNSFEAMGLPIPELPKNEQTSGLVKQIIDGVKNIITPKDNSTINNIQPIMRTDFVSVNQALNCRGLEEKEGKITLTVDQIKALNDALTAANSAKDKAEADLTTAKNDKKTAEDNLTAAISAIDALSDDVKNAADVTAKVQVIKNVLDKVPGMKPVNPTNQVDNVPDFSDVALDPINNFENE